MFTINRSRSLLTLTRTLSTATSSTSIPPQPLTTTPPPPPSSTSLPPPPPTPIPISDPPRPTSSIKQPIGTFRGAIIGFLLGLSTVTLYGYFKLLQDYQQASTTLLESVETLKLSTTKVTERLELIDRLETRLNELEKTSTKRREVDILREEFKKVMSTNHLDLLNLKAHVWAIEQDLDNHTKSMLSRQKDSNKNVIVRI